MGDDTKGNKPDFSKIYDLNKDQREIIDWRAQRRSELRQEYLKLRGDPNNRNHIFDSAIQRQYSTVFSYEHLFKPKLKNFAWVVATIAVPWYIIYSIVQSEKDGREERFRTGQVSYKDRDWKFV